MSWGQYNQRSKTREMRLPGNDNYKDVVKQGPQGHTKAREAVIAASETSKAMTGSFATANSQRAWSYSITDKPLSKDAKLLA